VNEPAVEPDSGYWRLEDQIRWYDRRSRHHRTVYTLAKTLQIAVAAFVPVTALLFPAEAIVPGVLGAAILVLEGVQEIGAHHRNWIKYRSTCEALRHEKHLFLALAGPYEGLGADDARRELALRVEASISEEHTHWVAHVTSRRRRHGADGAPEAAIGEN
jgi:hypothetical protein